mmetsp:Transcript_45519/g.119585  ORF Transcript_45519/g.119585 Transcript_45519/m.119585 type:complete len:229 (-) Transcript_45519:1598-2284(-)
MSPLSFVTLLLPQSHALSLVPPLDVVLILRLEPACHLGSGHRTATLARMVLALVMQHLERLRGYGAQAGPAALHVLLQASLIGRGVVRRRLVIEDEPLLLRVLDRRGEVDEPGFGALELQPVLAVEGKVARVAVDAGRIIGHGLRINQIDLEADLPLEVEGNRTRRTLLEACPPREPKRLDSSGDLGIGAIDIDRVDVNVVGLLAAEQPISKEAAVYLAARVPDGGVR